MEITLEIVRATVILRKNATDICILVTSLPSVIDGNKKLRLSFETADGCGADYIKKHFGTEPEVINS